MTVQNIVSATLTSSFAGVPVSGSVIVATGRPRGFVY